MSSRSTTTSSSSPDVYLFVISSLNHPIYRKIQEKRRPLLHHYKIPYTVLINEQESSLDDKKVPTLIPLNDEEIMYNGSGYNPYMAQKFLMAVKMLFRSYPSYDDIPTYIIRINATVYVHYPSLLETLHDKDFPKERVLAGPNWSNTFVQGMLMVFSKDVLANMLHDPRMYQKDIMRDNDDVSLSVLADPYSKWVDWNRHSCWYFRQCPRDEKGVYMLETIKPLENKIWMFRICEHENNREADIVNWDGLLKYFHEDDILKQATAKQPSTPIITMTMTSSSHPQTKKRETTTPFSAQTCLLIAIVLIVCGMMFLPCMDKDTQKTLCKKIQKIMSVVFPRKQKKEK